MLEELDCGPWDEVFHYAGEKLDGHSYAGEGASGPEKALPNDDISLDPISREDVVRIVAMDNGENDEKDWLIVGELKDGRFFCIASGCDYTGWG